MRRQLIAEDGDLGRGFDPYADSFARDADDRYDYRIAKPDSFLFTSRKH
jgi:hypothetical protein